ncbi:MAG: hypothetical protein ACYSWQ_27670, partial [Planctomycetota bacterium]
MSKRQEARKLGPVEVLVVVFVCVLALAACAPVVLRSRADAVRTKCAKNLSQIGRAMLIYANDYDDVFPRAGGRNCGWDRSIPSWLATNRFSAYGVAANGQGGRASISSCFYLLVKYAEVLPRTFVCPGDTGTTEFELADVRAGDRELIDLWDFGPEAYRHCSYSYHMPFGPFPVTMSSEPGLAVAADRNPWIDSPAGKGRGRMFGPAFGTTAVELVNAVAHEERGQNVLFVDGHVNFEDYPSCGVDGDNIYTFWNGGDIRRGGPPFLGMVPEHRTDSMLVHDPPPRGATKVTKESVRSLESTDLKQTSVAATLDCPLPENQNVIWCSTFQMAWDKLKKDVIGESVIVPDAAEIASHLNQGQFDHKNLEDESFYATAGIVKDGIVDQIQNEMSGRFPSQPKPVFDKLDALPQQIRRESIVAYSYLSVGIDFEYPFYVNKYPFEFHDSKGTPAKVKSFREHTGTGSLKSVSDQVDVLYFRDFDKAGDVDFAVDLSRNTEPYQVVLARMRRHGTLGQSVAAVEEKISEFEADPDYKVLRNLKPIDRLIVPDVVYKLTHCFAELEGKNLANPRWLGYFFLEAMQMIDFKLSRTG